MKPDLSLAGRYRTIWPALMTRVAWWWCSAIARACRCGMDGWRGDAAATVLGLVPILLVTCAWLVCCALVVIWPLAWLEFLPTRIAVRRGAGQVGPVYALCWFGFVPFAWVVALVLALRDVPPTAPVVPLPRRAA